MILLRNSVFSCPATTSTAPSVSFGSTSARDLSVYRAKNVGLADWQMGKTPHSAASIHSYICRAMKGNEPLQAGLLSPYLKRRQRLLTIKDNKLLQAGESAGAPPLRPTHLFPPRILVVDEDRDLRRLYTEALARPGYHVDAAEDGAAALKALRVNNYQLLITEHSLPTLTGVELVRTLRAARMALPVIMAATRLPIQELAQNPSLQPVAVLPKPFYISQLLETVRAILRAAVSPRGQLVPTSNWQSQPSVDGLRL
jgi:CheY-like chemotaxis protein